MTIELERLRRDIRSGAFRGTTSGRSARAQANLVVLPQRWAPDFREFCSNNARACPLLEETAPGAVAPSCAPEADLRTDTPRYRVYVEGRLVDEPTDVVSLWRDDLVSFLLGCSFNFEHALAQAGVPLRHQEQRKVVPMYITKLPCRSAGKFRGPLVVSMRPVPEPLVSRAVEVTRGYPMAHGEPVHIGAPEALGIVDLKCPDYGDAVRLGDGDVPLFWACGVTPQAVALEARPDLLLTHAPGHMFLTDIPL